MEDKTSGSHEKSSGFSFRKLLNREKQKTEISTQGELVDPNDKREELIEAFIQGSAIMWPQGGIGYNIQLGQEMIDSHIDFTKVPQMSLTPDEVAAAVARGEKFHKAFHIRKEVLDRIPAAWNSLKLDSIRYMRTVVEQANNIYLTGDDEAALNHFFTDPQYADEATRTKQLYGYAKDAFNDPAIRTAWKDRNNEIVENYKTGRKWTNYANPETNRKVIQQIAENVFSNTGELPGVKDSHEMFLLLSKMDVTE